MALVNPRTLRGFLNRLARRPTERTFACRIPPDHVRGERDLGERFTANGTYLVLRMAEMFLRDRREYLRGFLPLSVVLTELLYGDQRRTFTFLAGSQLLKDIAQYTDG